MSALQFLRMGHVWNCLEHFKVYICVAYPPVIKHGS